MSADLDLLKDAAREAGALAMDLRRRGLNVEHKVGGSPVTNADLASDALLTRVLRGARPDYGWLSEETPDNHERLSHQRLFLTDPIDGTTAFVKGTDWWSICIAVVDDERPVSAVVYAPSLDEMYEAEAGDGAFLNGQPIQVADRSAIDDCAMLGDHKMFVHPSWPTPWPAMRTTQRNSIAYRLSLVADGRFDACVAMAPKHDWDMAAGDLIVHEAGGLVTNHFGAQFRYNKPDPRQRSLVSAGPALHSLLLQRLAHIQD